MYSLTDAGPRCRAPTASRRDHRGSDDSGVAAAGARLAFRGLSRKEDCRCRPRLLRVLLKKRFVELEDVQADRDPLRSASARLRVAFTRPWPEGKLKKAERELLSYLELHPGSHNLAEVEEAVQGASEAARALARRKILTLEVEAPAIPPYPYKPPPALNRHQEAAFDAIRAAVESKTFQSFLLQGVTGSGKTEVYLRSIEATLASGRNALLLVPEIALDPCRRRPVLPPLRRSGGDPSLRFSRCRARGTMAPHPQRTRPRGRRDTVRSIRSGAESRPDHHR